jgi:hypothetical protein
VTELSCEETGSPGGGAGPDCSCRDVEGGTYSCDNEGKGELDLDGDANVGPWCSVGDGIMLCGELCLAGDDSGRGALHVRCSRSSELNPNHGDGDGGDLPCGGRGSYGDSGDGAGSNGGPDGGGGGATRQELDSSSDGGSDALRRKLS